MKNKTEKEKLFNAIKILKEIESKTEHINLLRNFYENQLCLSFTESFLFTSKSEIEMELQNLGQEKIKLCKEYESIIKTLTPNI